MEKHNYHIKRPPEFYLEPEEIFLDAQKDQRQKLEEPIKKRNFVLFYVFIGLIFILFLMRAAWLQVIKGDFYQTLAEKNRIRTVPIFTPRGIIYDKFGKQLVYNIPSFNLFVRVADLPKKKEDLENLINKISEILNRPSEDFKKIIEKSNPFSSEPLVLATDIERDKVLILKTEIQNLPGVSLEENPKRQYVFGPYLAHILGYVGNLDKEDLREHPNYFLTEKIGKSGLESQYQEILRGQPGKKEIEVDTFSKEKKTIASFEGQAGKGLILSVDSDLQNFLYDQLNKVLAREKLSGAAGVALNPQTGQILALVSLPSFDNNLLTQGLSQEDYLSLFENPGQPFFNRAISGQYPPGSTIKPLIGAAALEEKIIKPNQRINDQGDLLIVSQYNPQIVYRFSDWKVHGPVDIYQAIAQSCNVFFYHLGGGYGEFHGLGLERLEKYLKLFGLGKLTGIDLPSEKKGFIPNENWKKETKKEDWYIGDTYHLSIGQGDITLTPLQLSLATAAIANGGILFQPQIVDKIIDSEKNVIKGIESKSIKIDKFISKENLKIIQEAMRQTVTAGSAQSLQSLPVKVAGKTGTAQISGNKKPHAWFTAFAPYENPTIILTILIEEGGEGSTKAVPVAKEVLEWYFSR